MLKPNVPIFLCSIALIVIIPQSANSGGTSTLSVKKLADNPTGKKSSLIVAKKSISKSISLPAPDPKQMKFVHAYIRNNDDCLLTVKHRSGGPFTIIDSVLNHYGLPLELKYLAVIESELKPTALSRVGAKGPWQLMPGTAHCLGLKVNHKTDDRVNFAKSTRAAARYLKDLHREFRDWLLVLAAYNGGPRPVYRAIRKAHSRDFWVLQKYLPAESRMHVKKFIATTYYFEGDTAKKVTPAPPAPTVNFAVGKMQGETQETPETTNAKFSRLMKESARSLKTCSNLLETEN